MSALDNVTVCVTSYKRTERLGKCLESLIAAGIRKVVVASPCADEEIFKLITEVRPKFSDLILATTTEDVGCNATWLLAAYYATTKRILVCHDDDSLDPKFGEAYETIIAPCLDKRDAGWASWNAEIKYDDGRTEYCPYWQGSSRVMPSSHFKKIIMEGGSITYSPNVSIFNRSVVIRACKEAAETLTKNDSLERPGMLLGTELLVYLRHCDTFKRWLHLDKVLSYYGNHEGSGTVQAAKLKQRGVLMKGYDLARAQAACKPPEPTPRIFLVYSDYIPKDQETSKRHNRARESWDWHFNNSDIIELPYYSDGLPKIKDIIDSAIKVAHPEDIILYANADAGLTSGANELLARGVLQGKGVTCCITRDITPQPGRLYKNVTNCKAPGGIDAFAMTPQWWKAHREKMPDMFIGRHGWDNCLCSLAEAWADGRTETLTEPDPRLTSKAYTDNVCWHQFHTPAWQGDLERSIEQVHNTQLAKVFFQEREDLATLATFK